MGRARAAGGQAPAVAGRTGWWARVASPVTATVLGVLTLVLLAVAVVLSGLGHNLSILGTGPIVPVVLAYIGVGVIVARRQPRNPIGWILLVFILLFVFSTVAGLYAVLYYRLGYHGLPLAPVAVVLQPLWAPALLLFPVVILLFPDGGLASWRWRWVLWAYAVLGACVCLAVFGPAVAAVAGQHLRLDSSGDVVSKSHPPGGLAAAVWVLGLLAIAVIVLSFVAHQVLSWRRATGERRQQLKWLASGAAVTVILGIASFGVSSASAGGEVLGIGLAALPVGIGVGILKYRLYEIDRLISRTLAYAIVTGLLVGVYTGLVLLATHVLPFATPVAVAGSTLAAVALFNPLRRRVQRAVDRRFNRSRYDADAAVAAFAARLKDAVDLDTARAELAEAVHRSLEPAHVSVWIRQAG
jgi:hypothetical protein